MQKIILTAAITLALVGCQSQPMPSQPTVTVTQQTPATTPSVPSVATASSVVIHPYAEEEIQRQSIALPTTVAAKAKQAPQVMITPATKVVQNLDDGRQTPVVNALLQQAETAFTQQNFSQAESLALQAQRLAPQSAHSYLILAKIAMQQHKTANAQALAQRGLSLAPDTQMQQQLQRILQYSRQSSSP